MYSSGYSQVSKYSPQAQKKMQYRTKSKGCGYYMRIVFFFSSLIQSLIIVSLVLFLVYGKKQDSAATERIQDLEESFSSLSLENVELRKQRKNLTTLLNTTLIEKARNDWDLARIRHISNISSIIIEEINRQQQQCQAELMLCRGASRFNPPCSTPRQPVHGCDCGLQMERLGVKLEVMESNFSRTAERMRMETDLIARDRDNINLEAIRLRRDKAALEQELQHYRQRCKEDFRLSLSGIGNVSKAFLQKIETLFPTHLSFQLTCEKQQEHLEQIRSNCTNLSRDVEDKFQRYLNNVGDQVSNIQRENSRLKTENGLLNEDYRKCSQNRTGMMREHRAYINQLQLKHDKDTERHLVEKSTLSGNLELLNKSIKLKDKEVEHLSDQVRQLNSTCIFRQPFPGGSTNRFNSAWNLNNGAAGSPYNRPATGGIGSTNYGSAGSNTGYGAGGSQYNKPATGGYGSTGSNTGVSQYNKPASGGYGSTGSNTGTGAGGSQYNKPATGGYGSTGSNTGTGAGGSPYNKPAAGGYGSTGSNTGTGAGGSPYNKPATGGYGSAGSNTGQGAGGSTYNKPATGGLGSSSYGSAGAGINKVATSATGSSTGSASSGVNKQGTSATGSSSYGSTGSSSGGASAVKPVTNSRGTSTQGQTPGSAGSTGSAGTAIDKPASSGSSASTGKSLSSWWNFGASSNTQNKPGSTAGKGTSSGSPVGTGRTSGVGGGSINVAQHLLELQRIVNPSAPEEKQDLSRMLG